MQSGPALHRSDILVGITKSAEVSGSGSVLVLAYVDVEKGIFLKQQQQLL